MNNVLHYAMNIGEQMLMSGADIRRVEESVTRICYAYNAKRIDVYIITSSIVATIYNEDGSTYTQTRRVKSINTDIERMHLLNDLSRKICKEKLSFAEIDKELENIQHCKHYNLIVECLAYAMIATAFTLFFGGNIIEAIVSCVVGISCCFSALIAKKTSMGRLFSKFFCSFVSAIIAFIAVKLNFIDVVDKIIIGNIMVLIPGIGITNALKDLLSGDSVAGFFKTVEAILMGLSIAAGYIVVALIIGGVIK